MTKHRIILDRTQTECLRAHEIHFAIVVPGSYPDAGGNAVLHLLPIDKEQADAAIAVALGKATAKKKRNNKRSNEQN